MATQLYYYWRLHRVIAPAQPTRLLAAMHVDGVIYFFATITVKLSAALIVCISRFSLSSF